MKVLFVCVGNSARLQMAEALFNRLAPKNFAAMSAGTQPTDSVSLKAIEVMKEIGIYIITMGCINESLRTGA